MEATIPVVAKVGQTMGHPASLGVLRGGTIAVERTFTGAIYPGEIREKGIDEIEPEGVQPFCDLCGVKEPSHLHIYYESSRTLKLCNGCNHKPEGLVLKSVHSGSEVYGSKISKIADVTGLSKVEVESILRRLFSTNLVSRDKSKNPTRWFSDW